MAFPMKVYLAEKKEDSVTFKFTSADPVKGSDSIRGTDTTLIMPLLEELNANEDVKIARFINKHPELEDTALYIQMKKGDPVEAIKKAADALAVYFE